MGQHSARSIRKADWLRPNTYNSFLFYRYGTSAEVLSSCIGVLSLIAEMALYLALIVTRMKYRLESLLVALYCLGFFVVSQQAAWQMPYRVNNDWSQHLVWLSPYGDHHFQADDYFLATAHLIQPWGIQGVNYALGQFFDPLVISHFGPFFMLLATCWFTYLLLREKLGWPLALAAMVMMSNIPFERMVGFFARAYAFPLLMGFLYFWVRENYRGVGLFLVLSALFYPVTFLLVGGILGMEGAYFFLRRQWGDFWSTHKVAFVGLLVGIGVVLAKSYVINTSDLLGGFLDREALLSWAEFGPGGRVNFQYAMNVSLPFEWNWERFFDVPGVTLEWVLVVGLIVLLLLQIVLRSDDENSRLDRSILFLGLGGTLLFYAAQWLLPRLFLPNRYLYFSYLPFLYLLMVRGIHLVGTYLKKPRLVSLLFSPMLIVLIFLTHSPLAAGLDDYGRNGKLYEQISALEGPQLIAGPFDIMSQIPTFCRQSVLFSGENIHGLYFKHYYEYVTPRIRDFYDAYTSTDVADLKSFIVKYGIDYLVVERAFLRDKTTWLYEPHQTIYQAKLTEMKVEDLALNKVPEVFFSGDDPNYVLLDCQGLLDR